MVVTFSRGVDPYTAMLHVEINEQDFKVAFPMQEDPDEPLFYGLFGFEFRDLPVSGKLNTFKQVAALVEAGLVSVTTAASIVEKEVRGDG